MIAVIRSVLRTIGFIKDPPLTHANSCMISLTAAPHLYRSDALHYVKARAGTHFKYPNEIIPK